MTEGFPIYNIGKLWVIVGFALIVAGLMIMGGSRFSFFGLGKLPGDIAYRSKNTAFYFPVVSLLVVSVLLTLLIWLISWLTRR
ncbi:MAG: DUF2905 domain-containing protein [Terriglobia bacterium]